jgi:2-C-methyl-D-erythritol 2,4-cyclodiphosphate synthase
MFRIGFGFDTHKLTEGHDFLLGGIRIDHHSGAEGHSDADTLVHAIIDALLGAAGLSDIGSQFPDHDPRFRGIDSKMLLARTMEMVRNKGYAVGNIDSTIVLQSPKIANSIPAMIETLSAVMCIDPGQISIKAKTSEKLGFIGREEGLSAYAVALLTQQ